MAEYGEDIGVLTGDALMMFAFETAANAFETSIAPDELSRIGRAMGILAHKTGVYGMIGARPWMWSWPEVLYRGTSWILSTV